MLFKYSFFQCNIWRVLLGSPFSVCWWHYRPLVCRTNKGQIICYSYWYDAKTIFCAHKHFKHYVSYQRERQYCMYSSMFVEFQNLKECQLICTSTCKYNISGAQLLNVKLFSSKNKLQLLFCQASPALTVTAPPTAWPVPSSWPLPPSAQWPTMEGPLSAGTLWWSQTAAIIRGMEPWGPQRGRSKKHFHHMEQWSA